MPKEWLELKKKLFTSMRGKENPRTGKPYTEDELDTIAVTQYKVKTGHAPSREDSPNWYCESGKEVRENVNLLWTESLNFDKNEGSKIKSNEPLKISGTAISETITKNKIKYTSEELESAVPSLIDRPILDSHNSESVKNILGKVINAYKSDGGVIYEAEIDPSERVIINKIKNGYINKVSIGARVKELIKEVNESDEADERYVAKGIQFQELSLVPVPGDDNTSINLTHALSESFNGTDLIKLNENNGDMEELSMEKEFDALKAENNSLKEELKKLQEEKLKAEADKALEERINKIISEKLDSLKVKEQEEGEDEKEDKTDKTEDEADDTTEESKGVVQGEDVKEKDKTSFEGYHLERFRDGIDFFKL